MTSAERIAYEAGTTAAERIGEKAMCYDPIMCDLIVDAQSLRGHIFNARVMAAWHAGREFTPLEDQISRYEEYLQTTTNRIESETKKLPDLIGDWKYNFTIRQIESLKEQMQAIQHSIKTAKQFLN